MSIEELKQRVTDLESIITTIEYHNGDAYHPGTKKMLQEEGLWELFESVRYK